jgi:MFS family permease
MAWYVSTTVVYLVLLPLLLSGIAEDQLWRYGIFIGAVFAVIIMILRYVFIGESAMWAARVGRYDEACDILRKRYGVHARVALEKSIAQASQSENKIHTGYGILFNGRYRKRTILGCIVATMQAWQYNAVGVYLPLTLAGILSGGLAGALSGSAVVNALCGISGGLIGSLILQRLGTRLQSMYGFAVVTLALLALGALATTNPWLSGVTGCHHFLPFCRTWRAGDDNRHAFISSEYSPDRCWFCSRHYAYRSDCWPYFLAYALGRIKDGCFLLAGSGAVYRVHHVRTD